MPYAVRGNKVIKKNTGEVVGTSKKPKVYIKVLRAIDNGWKKSK